MDLIVVLVIGAVVGAISSLVTRSTGGMLWNVLIGCAGALVGEMQFGALSGGGQPPVGPFGPLPLLVAVLGAVVLVSAYNLASRNVLR